MENGNLNFMGNIFCQPGKQMTDFSFCRVACSGEKVAIHKAIYCNFNFAIYYILIGTVYLPFKVDSPQNIQHLSMSLFRNRGIDKYYFV